MVNVLSGKQPDGPDPAETPAAEPPKEEAAGPDGKNEAGADGGGDTEAGETPSAVASSGAE